MLHRRAFLGTLSSAACLAGAPGIRPAFGFSLYGMKALALHDAIQLCGSIGYRAVELALMPGWPSEPKLLSSSGRRELRSRLRDAGVRVAALMENLRLLAPDEEHRANLEKLKQAVQLAHDLDSSEPPVIETILGSKRGEWEVVKHQMADRLRTWEPLFAGSRTVLAVKPHYSNALRTPEAALWLLDQVPSPWVRLAYDYSHFQPQGMSLPHTMELLISRSVFIHIKDVRWEGGSIRFLLPGEGSIDYSAYAAALNQHAYRGAVVVEVSGQVFQAKDYDPRRTAEYCFARLSRFFPNQGSMRGRADSTSPLSLIRRVSQSWKLEIEI